MKKMEKIDELEEFKEKMQKEDSDKLKLTSNCLHILISWAKMGYNIRYGIKNKIFLHT